MMRFFKGDARTVRARKNIGASALIKGADMLVYFLLVPLSIGYLNKYEYGIWLTLNSFLSWINYFDIGLGSGLRNKLAIAMANDDKERARDYVSTTFLMLIGLMLVIFLLFALLVNRLDWFSLLNVSEEIVPNLKEIIVVSFAFFCLNFILKFIGNVYQALQLPAVSFSLAFDKVFPQRQSQGGLFAECGIFHASDCGTGAVHFFQSGHFQDVRSGGGDALQHCVPIFQCDSHSDDGDSFADVAGMCLTYLPGAVLNTIQFGLLMKGRARGIFAIK